MKLPRLALLCLALSGCAEWGLLVEIQKTEAVGDIDSVRVRIEHPDLTTEQVYSLGEKELPQTVAVVSNGIVGEAQLTVEGLSPGRKILGRARQAVTLVQGKRVNVTMTLELFCPVGATNCCVPKTCAAGFCGMLDDGCGAMVSCGCDAGLTCGGGDAGPDHCGFGACTKLTACPSGLNCGTVSDNCGSTVSCGGACPMGQTCGAGADGGRPNVCGCQRLTACPAGACGMVPDGCGGTLNCAGCSGTQRCVLDGGAGSCCTPRTACAAGAECGMASDGCGGMIACAPGCTTPRTCEGGPNPQPNKCGCTPQCGAAAACGANDGCGGQCQTGGCDAGQACSAGKCCGLFGEANCNGVCTNIYSSPTNCGRCGVTCSGGSECDGYACTCRTPAENADGHCCPPGFTMRTDHGGTQLLCFSGLLDAGTYTEALSTCRSLTASTFDGGGISAVGAGRSPLSRHALPSGDCGSQWASGLDASVVRANAGSVDSVQACSPGGAVCSATCGSCSTPLLACEAQPYRCVVEPLGVTVQTCSDDSSCPPGIQCFAFMGPGSCFSIFPQRPCVRGSDCGLREDGGQIECLSRNGPVVTGYCNAF